MGITTSQHLKEMYWCMRDKMAEMYHFDESLPGPARDIWLPLQEIPNVESPLFLKRIVQRILAYEGPKAQEPLIDMSMAKSRHLSRRYIQQRLEEMVAEGGLALTASQCGSHTLRIYSLPI